jgi:hypothetical protein
VRKWYQGVDFIPADAFGTMVAVNALGSLIAGPTPALVWSIYTDVADYGEWRFGRRTTGLVFSVAMFAQKMGLTIGGGAFGWLLGYYGFQANAEQTEGARQGRVVILPAMPRISLAAVVLEPLRAASGIFEDQGAAITEGDFFWPPIRAYSFARATAHKLVERVWLGVGWGSCLVEPVPIRLVIGDPSFDRLPGNE